MTATSGVSFADKLAELHGAEHLVRLPGLDVDGVRPAIAIAPATLEEAAAMLRLARESGATVAPWGGGAQQMVGPPPERLDLVLQTERLNAVREWEPSDLTACLDAGLTLAQVQSILARHGQQLPIDAPDAGRATLGGLMATNTSGPRRWRYGGWRDLIIGMHMALTDGTVVKSGGRVVKNVQGYDLAKLFIGSLGTLGFIGQINVKLSPLPAARRIAVSRGPLPVVSAFVSEVAASTLRASAVDLLNAEAVDECGLAGASYAGLVLLEGQPAVVDASSTQLLAMAMAAGGTFDTVEQEARETAWDRWVNLGRTSDLGAGEALLTVHARPSEVAEAVRALVLASEGQGARALIWARSGNGVVFARLSIEKGEAIVAFPTIQRNLLARWPATTLVAGDPAVERAARPWGLDPPGLAQMQLIKQQFDPTGVLNPGRLIGGWGTP